MVIFEFSTLFVLCKDGYFDSAIILENENGIRQAVPQLSLTGGQIVMICDCLKKRIPNRC